MNNKVFISKWDTNHFGFKVAKTDMTSVKEILPAESFCSKKGVKLLIIRVATDNTSIVHKLQEQGTGLMDTNLRYYLSLASIQVMPVLGPAVIRSCLKADANNVSTVAKAAHAGYIGHFHNDPRLDRNKCDALYTEWAKNLCLDQNLANLVLVAEIEGKIVGYDSHKLINTNVADGVLSGVSPLTQKKGIRKALVVASNNWCKSHGLERMEEEVSINNYRMQSILIGSGFKLYAAEYIFHKWY